MRRLADAVLSMIVTGLGWPSDYFLCRCDKPTAQLRILHYPRQVASGDTLSVGPHSDYEALTILSQDDVGGLQIRRPDGSWIDVTPIPDAFVLNIGEMLTMWTNGLLPATLHRVRTPRSADRYSVAFFYGTNYDAVIEPPAAELGPGLTRHEPTTAGEYLERRLREVGG
jgi:isopenicillin N synthase-like dioxygenase